MDQLGLGIAMLSRVDDEGNAGRLGGEPVRRVSPRLRVPRWAPRLRVRRP